MSSESAAYEQEGKFYLGRNYDLETRQPGSEDVLYDSKDLVTHGVVLGMTGSGKTGLCMALLEEAAVDGIPALVIDPKGDIANLLLTFPDFRGEDFRPWIDESEARRKGRSPEDHAEKTARMWENGLHEWGQDGERVRRFQDKVEINIFTPGSNAGIPVSILSSLEVPPFEIMDDGELLSERIESTVSSLLSLIGVDADPIQSPEAVLLANIFKHIWDQGHDLTIQYLIHSILKPPFAKIGVFDTESFLENYGMREKHRQGLAYKFNNLLASPGFSTWLEGPPLDINKMLWTDDGKPRVSIFSIAHLSDTERMFFVSLLLNQTLGWMRTQSGTSSLRALLYMDEIYGYLPPVANPPSKKPMMTLLKQARAFGLGVLVATQNPVDLDYKALSNIGTWWLGRLQTERDKARVMDGLESAAEGSFNRREIEKILSDLEGRVFLMNNVKEDSPVLMHVRWVMSYLCGPLTRSQIKTLMDPVRHRFPEKSVKPGDNPMSQTSAREKPRRPIVGPGVTELFAPATENTTYHPTLLRQAKVRFSYKKYDLEASRLIRKINPIGPEGIDWKTELTTSSPEFQNDPTEGATFAELPGYAMNADNYKDLDHEFEDQIYRKERLTLFHSELYDQYSRTTETEDQFRARLATEGEKIRCEAEKETRENFHSKLDRKKAEIDRAERTLETEKSQATAATADAGMGVLGRILSHAFGGRKSRASLTGKASRAMKQRSDVKRAEARVEDLQSEFQDLQADLETLLQELRHQYDPATLALEIEEIAPYKKDIQVTQVALLWLPQT